MHAVERTAAVIVHAELIKKHRRRHAVALDAAVHLRAGLRGVDEHGLFVFMHKVRDKLHTLKARRVLGVKAEAI